jgi:hypothetical protein
MGECNHNSLHNAGLPEYSHGVGWRHPRSKEAHLIERGCPYERTGSGFLSPTHNYNVVPKDGDVELDLNGKILTLIPNGEKSGLCDMEY